MSKKFFKNDLKKLLKKRFFGVMLFKTLFWTGYGIHFSVK